MSSIDNSISEVRARIAELEPVEAELRMLRRTLGQLEDLKLHDEDPEAWEEQQRLRERGRPASKKQAHMPKDRRVQQIVELIARDESITNVEMARILDISDARVGQLRPLAEEKLAEQRAKRSS